MKSAVEWYCNKMDELRIEAELGKMKGAQFLIKRAELFEKAMEKEKKQLFKSANQSAKEAYIAGQRSMYCGCYDIDGCTTYENWLYEETFKSE